MSFIDQRGYSLAPPAGNFLISHIQNWSCHYSFWSVITTGLCHRLPFILTPASCPTTQNLLPLFSGPETCSMIIIIIYMHSAQTGVIWGDILHWDQMRSNRSSPAFLSSCLSSCMCFCCCVLNSASSTNSPTHIQSIGFYKISSHFASENRTTPVTLVRPHAVKWSCFSYLSESEVPTCKVQL